MKVMATPAVLLLLAGAANASLMVYNDTPVYLGTVPAGSTAPPAGAYYGVTVHFVSSDPAYKAAGFTLTVTGPILQWKGYRGDSAGRTFWLDDLNAQLHDSAGDGNSLTPREAAFASHTLFGSANCGLPQGGVPDGPSSGYGLSTRVTGNALNFFGDTDDGYQARAVLQPWIWQDPANGNSMSFAILTPYRQQDLPFIYLVMPAGRYGELHIRGTVVMSTDTGLMYNVPVDWPYYPPEPATVAILSFGAVALLRRRRRASMRPVARCSNIADLPLTK